MSYEERREQIISIAFEMFAENGFKKTGTKNIAKKAGISEALIFKHFPQKQDLYKAIIQKMREFVLEKNKEFQSIVRDYSESSKISLGDVLEIFMENFYKSSGEKNHYIFRLIMYSMLEDQKFSSLFFESVEKNRPLLFLFSEAKKKGEIRDFEVEVVEKIFIGMVQSLSAMIRCEEENGEKRIGEIIEIFLKGVLVRDGRNAEIGK